MQVRRGYSRIDFENAVENFDAKELAHHNTNTVDLLNLQPSKVVTSKV